MFNKLVASGGKKKGVMGAGATLTSVIVHAGLLGGLVAVGVGAEAVKKQQKDEVVNYVDVPPPPKAPEPAKPEPPPPPPPKEEAAPPVVKGTQALEPPETPPPALPPVNPNEKAVKAEDFSGQGTIGGVASGVENGQAQDVSKRETPPDQGTYDISAVEVKPSLSNNSAVARALERNYPPLLRDAGVAGTVTMQFVVGTDGRVDASTIEVVDASNSQFSDAARRVVELMRFRPAQVGGRPVRVKVQLPIQFQSAG